MAKQYAARMPLPTTNNGQYYVVAIPVSQGGGLATTSGGGVHTDKIDMTTPRRRNNSLPGQTSVPSFPGFRDEMAIQKPPPIVSAPSMNNSSAAQVQAQSTLPMPTLMASKTPLPQLSSTLKGKGKARNTSTHSLAAGPLSESLRAANDGNVISLLPAKTEQTEPSLSAVPRAIGPPVGRKKQRRKWSIDETRMLVAGCNKHGVGNWKAILDDSTLTFAEDRTPVDLKDRFRTYFPQSYRQLYPNAKTHLSSGRARAELPDTYDLFEKNRSKKRRPFTPEEDAALREGFEKHGTVWALIAKNPVLASRRSTDLRDRFRNAFPDLYEQAGYKPRPSRMQKKKSRSYEPPSHPQEQSLERVQEAPDDPEEEEADMACDGPYSHAAYVQDSKAVLLEQSRPASAPGAAHPSMSPRNDPSPPAASLIQAATTIPSNANADGGGAQAQTPGTMHAALPYQAEARMHPSSASPPPAQLSPSTTRSHSTTEYFPNGETRGGYDPSMFDLKPFASWYPHRWLSATGAGGATTRVDDLAEYQPQTTSGGANAHIWQTWLPSGGWANQQAVIDRYDLPAPSFVHEFASEAAVGDTGSSISGAADVALPPSSHHRYAGDLFHGRGTYGGYGGPLSFVFNPGQMSFGRAALAMDFGDTNAGSAPVGGRGVRPQDLTLNTMDEYPNVSMEELSTSASEPLTVQASSPPPFSQQLQRQQIQPLSSASSSQHRLDALTEGLSLSSPPQSPDPLSPPPPMNSNRSFSSTDGYPVSSSARQQWLGGSTNSHSRSLSQPPSEHRLPMDVRSATALNSPVHSLYELTNGNAGFSPLPFDGQTLYGPSSPVPQVPQSPIHTFGDQQQQQNTQLGRQFLNEFYNPQSGMFSLSTAAAALDLHGFNGPVHSAHSLHLHNYGFDRQFLSYQGTPTMGTTSLCPGLGLGPPPGATGNNQASPFGGMDQYVDFGTANALDLATGPNNSNSMNNNYSTNGLGGSMLGLVEEPASISMDPNAGRSYALQMSPSQASRQQPQPLPLQLPQQLPQAGQGGFSGRVMSAGGAGVGIPPAFTQLGPTSASNHQHSSSGELFAGAASGNNSSNGVATVAARPDIGRKRASWGGQR